MSGRLQLAPVEVLVDVLNALPPDLPHGYLRLAAPFGGSSGRLYVPPVDRRAAFVRLQALCRHLHEAARIKLHEERVVETEAAFAALARESEDGMHGLLHLTLLIPGSCMDRLVALLSQPPLSHLQSLAVVLTHRAWTSQSLSYTTFENLTSLHLDGVKNPWPTIAPPLPSVRQLFLRDLEEDRVAQVFRDDLFPRLRALGVFKCGSAAGVQPSLGLLASLKVLQVGEDNLPLPPEIQRAGIPIVVILDPEDRSAGRAWREPHRSKVTIEYLWLPWHPWMETRPRQADLRRVEAKVGAAITSLQGLDPTRAPTLVVPSSIWRFCRRNGGVWGRLPSDAELLREEAHPLPMPDYLRASALRKGVKVVEADDNLEDGLGQTFLDIFLS